MTETSATNPEPTQQDLCPLVQDDTGPKPSAAPHLSPRLWGLVGLCILLFWGLRITYWGQIDEVPFSDMADYQDRGSQLLRNGTFGSNPFWRSYKPPMAPLLIALVFWVFGDGNLTAWRLFQTLFLFLSLIFAARELARSSGRTLLGFGLFIVVTLSRPSVFWSYKIGTESLAEAFNYLVLGMVLVCWRAPNLKRCALVGALVMLATLNRPQFLPVLPLVGLLLGWRLLRDQDGHTSILSRIRLKSPGLLAYGLSAILIWSPWLLHTHSLYGHVVPLSTQGPYSFLWELGPVTLKTPEGKGPTKTRLELQDEAPSQFQNDHQAMVYAQGFVRSWLADHWREYPALVWRRAKHSLRDRKISLSKISRTHLLPPFIDWMLLDKHYWLGISGALGLLLLSFTAGRGTFAPGLICLAPWFMGCLFLGYARILEPGIPLLLFGNFAYLTPLIPLKPEPH